MAQSEQDPLARRFEEQLDAFERGIEPYVPYLLDAGVSADQIDQAITHGKEQRQKEFERRQIEDPISQLAAVFTSSAVTEDDRVIAAYRVAEMGSMLRDLTIAQGELAPSTDLIAPNFAVLGSLDSTRIDGVSRRLSQGFKETVLEKLDLHEAFLRVHPQSSGFRSPPARTNIPGLYADLTGISHFRFAVDQPTLARLTRR